jgi:hypothetical protein
MSSNDGFPTLNPVPYEVRVSGPRGLPLDPEILTRTRGRYSKFRRQVETQLSGVIGELLTQPVVDSTIRVSLACAEVCYQAWPHL